MNQHQCNARNRVDWIWKTIPRGIGFRALAKARDPSITLQHRTISGAIQSLITSLCGGYSISLGFMVVIKISMDRLLTF